MLKNGMRIRSRKHPQVVGQILDIVAWDPREEVYKTWPMGVIPSPSESKYFGMDAFRLKVKWDNWAWSDWVEARDVEVL